MLAECSHLASLGVIPWATGGFTLVLKLTLELGRDGVFVLVDEGPAVEPLRLETLDAEGRLLWPTDFSPAKAACDVMVIGEDDERGERRLRVDGLDVALDPEDHLGPIGTALPGGDPSAAPQAWPGLPPARFQTAIPDLQIPFPEGSFEVVFERGERRLAGRFEGPWPRVALTPIASLTMVLDAVALALRPDRLIVTFRGYSPIDPREVHPAVELVDRAGALAPGAVWSSLSVQTPRDALAQRGAAALAGFDAPASTTSQVLVGAGAALPFSRLGAPPVPPPVAPAPAPVPAARATPVAPTAPPTPPMVVARATPAIAAPPPRAQAHTLPAVEDLDGGEEVGTSTVATSTPSALRPPLPFTTRAGAAPATALSASATPFAPSDPQPPAARSLDGPLAPAVAPPWVEPALPARAPVFRLPEAAAPPPSAVAPRAGKASEPEPDLEAIMARCARVRAAVWSGLALVDALASHALDEATYRKDEQRLAAELAAEVEAGRADRLDRWLAELDEARTERRATPRAPVGPARLP